MCNSLCYIRTVVLVGTLPLGHSQEWYHIGSVVFDTPRPINWSTDNCYFHPEQYDKTHHFVNTITTEIAFLDSRLQLQAGLHIVGFV